MSDAPSPHQRQAKQPPPKYLDQVEACMKFTPDPTVSPTFRTHKSMITVPYDNNMSYLLAMGYQRDYFKEQQEQEEQRQQQKEAEAQARTKRLMTHPKLSPTRTLAQPDKPRFILKQFMDVKPKVNTQRTSSQPSSPTKA